MHVFVAGPEDPRDEGFNHAISGELVYVGFMCATDEQAPDPGRGGCGCGRAFAGVASHKATTLAVVADLDITRDEYVDALASGISWAYGGGPTDDDLLGFAEEMADLAAEYEVGTVLTRSGYRISPFTLV